MVSALSFLAALLALAGSARAHITFSPNAGARWPTCARARTAPLTPPTRAAQ
jgi:hypothetical protein